MSVPLGLYSQVMPRMQEGVALRVDNALRTALIRRLKTDEWVSCDQFVTICRFLPLRQYKKT